MENSQNQQQAGIPLETGLKKSWRSRARYQKELALRFLDKDRKEPGPIRDGLTYTGRANGFLIVPNELIYSGVHLSPGEKVVWLAIFLHNWDPNPSYRVSWPGRERLAIISGKSVRQVSNCLEGLRRKGLLKTKRRLNKPSLYLLNDPPEAWMQATKKELDELKRKKKAERQKKFDEAGNEYNFQAESE